MDLQELINKYARIVSRTKRSTDRYTKGKHKAFKEVLRDLQELQNQSTSISNVSQIKDDLIINHGYSEQDANQVAQWLVKLRTTLTVK